MRKYFFALIACLGLIDVSAQQVFTERLQVVNGSEGRIVLHQDKNITDLVNGTTKRPSSRWRWGEADGTAAHVGDSTAVDSLLHGPKMKINGYRIQVYFGDNSRNGKNEAKAAGQSFKNYFPELPVYVSFVSPHWLCRAGDFRTMEEAGEVLSQIRTMGIFREAVIVRSKINVRLQ